MSTPDVRQALVELERIAIGAVYHVGAANYAEREREALQWVRKAADAARAALAEQPASVAEGTIVLPSGHRVVIADAREDIAHVLQYWLDHNKRQADEDGRAVTRATHVVPTEWPDRGTLENWIAVLRAQGPSLAAAPKPEVTKL